MDSTPAATNASPSPALTAWNAIRIVCRLDAQKRLTVVPEQRCAPGQQARRIGLDGHVRQQLLHELERRDRLAELPPFRGVARARLDAAAADPDAAGGERDAAV